MQGCRAAHLAHCSAHTMPTVQLTHWAQFICKSHGEGCPDELFDVELVDVLEFDEDKPEPPCPVPPAPPVPGSSKTTLAPHAEENIVRAPNNIGKASCFIIGGGV